MAKIKLTKNELKAQRDSLRRFQRYLPTLQLKKQQLQVELRQLRASIAAGAAQEEQLRGEIDAWVKLFTEPFPFADHLRVRRLLKSTGNIAGVAIPVLDILELDHAPHDLFLAPPWVDDGLRVLEQLLRLRVELEVLREQRDRLEEELRLTNQRVNLFEKVKIPEAQEHIRVIRIFLGDQQTAGVARAKIAKGKSVEREAAA